MTGPTICGQPAGDRLMASVRACCWTHVEPPTREQVAVVCHALADYTLLQDAIRYRIEDGDTALAVGRYLHAIADQMRDR